MNLTALIKRLPGASQEELVGFVLIHHHRSAELGLHLDALLALAVWLLKHSLGSRV